MPVDVVLGLQWGDEGKGKVVDTLADKYDVVARFQGGNNAGHTIYIDNKKVVLHHVPSGIRHKDTINLLGNGMVIDPVELIQEIKDIQKVIPDITDRIYVCKGCHLILPIHKQRDKDEEEARGKNKIGTTQKGIGPCYQDKYARKGITLRDLVFTAREKYDEIHKETIVQEEETHKEFWSAYQKIFEILKVVDGMEFIHQCLEKNKNVLAEGAQGTMLDIDQGSYPYVTSSHTSIGGVLTGLGVAPQDIRNVYGVTKAYATRVGEGPFPTEMSDKDAEILYKEGKEIGATTGRRRRLGYLDLEQLFYSIKFNGVTELIVTKVDVVEKLKLVPLRTIYEGSQRTYYCESSFDRMDECDEVGEFKNIKIEFTKPDKYPVWFNWFLTEINKGTKIPIKAISYGPHREDYIEL